MKSTARRDASRRFWSGQQAVVVLGTAQHGLDHFVGLKLGQRLVGTHLMGPLHADLAGERGVQDDVGTCQRRIALHLEGQFIAVESRHLYVAHQYVDGSLLAGASLHQGQCILAVGADFVGNIDVVEGGHRRSHPPAGSASA